MTKVYVVVGRYIGKYEYRPKMYISLVFTNYAKALAYCDKMNEDNQKYVYTIEEHSISKVDFRKIPY